MHVQIQNVSKSYPGVLALSDVTFQVEQGSLHAICGENGAGKSTLMKILSGVETGFAGELIVKGESVRFKSTRDAESVGISIIHQELNLVEELSAAANIFLGRELRTPWGWIDDHAMEDASRKLLLELECQVDPRTLAGELRVGDQQLL